jgi:hypothetical protein
MSSERVKAFVREERRRRRMLNTTCEMLRGLHAPGRSGHDERRPPATDPR